MCNALQYFTPTTTSETRSIIQKCSNKSCDLDHFPTFILKRCIDQLIHPITTISNKPMQDGVVSGDFKHALVIILLKNKILATINGLRNTN